MLQLEQRLSALPTDNITVKVLNALDTIVPGQWENIRSLDAMITRTTGLDGQGVKEDLRQQLAALNSQPYERALWLFETIDKLDQVAAGAAVASKVTDLFGGLDFLKEFTPKAETTQALDAGLKLVVEVLALGLMKGLPKPSVEEMALFVAELSRYGKADVMRLTAWVVIDGLLPLGPDFMRHIIGAFDQASQSKLAGHSIFEAVADYLPGDSTAQKQAFVTKTLGATSDFIGSFVKEKGLSRQLIISKLSGVVDISDDTLDYVAAGLDASTSYFSHTGTQSVARVMVEQAFTQLQAKVWQDYLARRS